jgi:methionyl-tRNA formyltransferase
MDAGPVILQEETSIRSDENAGALHDRLALLGGKLAVRGLDLIDEGRAEFREQDNSKAVYCKKIHKEDACIRWDRPAEEIVRFVRAMTPYPGAYTFSGKDGRRVKVSEVAEVSFGSGDAVPGTVIEASDKEGITVAVQDGSVRIIRLAPAGSRRMTSQEFVMGASVEKGDRLVSEPNDRQLPDRDCKQD